MIATTVPVEIWHMVADRLGPIDEKPTKAKSRSPTRSDFVNLQLTCRYFRNWTAPLLFREIVITIPHYEDHAGWIRWEEKMEDLETGCILDHARELTVKTASHIMPQVASLAHYVSRLMRFTDKLQNLKAIHIEVCLIERYDQALLELCVALATSRKITNLKISTNQRIQLEQWNPRPPLPPSVSSHMQHLIGNLTHLSIKQGHHSWSIERTLYTEHLDAAWALLKYARNLTSLDICLSDVYRENYDMNMHLHALENMGPEKLNELTLKWTCTSADSLMRLISRYSHCLTHITLERIKLTKGNWEEVLLHLCQLPYLTNFWIHHCDYTRSNSSWQDASNYWEEDRRMRNGWKEISPRVESRNRQEFLAVGHIERHVNRVRMERGLLPYDNETYEYAKLPPMDG